MAEDTFHSNSKDPFSDLNQAFQAWDGGEPSSAVWEKLEESIVLESTWSKLEESLTEESVWNRLNNSLDQEFQKEHRLDEQLQESFESWDVQSSTDGWLKLNDELAKERVWLRLLASLNRPILVRVPFLKMTAATVLFMLLAFHTDYSSDSLSSLRWLNQGIVSQEPSESISTKQSLAANADSESSHGSIEPAFNNQKFVKSNKSYPYQFGEMQYAGQENGSIPTRISDKSVVTGGTHELPVPGTQPKLQMDGHLSNQDFMFDSLEPRELLSEYKDVAHFDKPKSMRFYLKPRWSIGVGSQFSIINEKNRSALTSAMPQFGWAGDLASHLYFGQFRWTNGLGFAQYSQGNGRYMNGRYETTNQRLNTAYFMSTGGYVYKGFSVYGGFTINKLLNGYEQNNRVMTNVYNSKNIQLGGIAGIDYNLKPFRNKSCIGFNMQYQFVPQLKSSNQLFNDIHGIRFQIKFSF